MRAAAVIVGAIALSSVLTFAQGSSDDTSSTLSFDVVSVKPSKSADDSRSFRFTGNRFVASNVPVTTLLILAYGVPVESVLNAPRWIENDRFDISGTFGQREGRAAGPSRSDRDHMFRQLLKDRFHLSVREVTVAGEAYALLPKGNQPGPALKVSSGNCGKECGTRSDRPALWSVVGSPCRRWRTP